MNNLSNDDIVECPLCMEQLEVDDLNFFPCTCGYQICRFCWHRIRTDENQLCPACRKEYPENPADFKPLSQEEMVAFKFQKRQRDQKRKQEITENRKHLANVRVVQKNLVFVVGLPPRLADAEILKKHEYFGKYGKIHKVVINPSTTYAGVQGPSASAYVTYVHNPDALRAIQSVNNIMIDGRLIKTSLGTTKYCSHFMKNQQCPKADCMYLHELGDPEASFTKEEMHQGKHQDYEKRLHDMLIATSGASTAGGLVSSVAGPTTCSTTSTTTAKVAESSKGTGVLVSSASKTAITANEPSISNSSSSVAIAAAAVNGQQTEAWPCLSVSPVNKKETLTSVGSKSKKERNKQEKVKAEKNSKTKNKNNSNSQLASNKDTESQASSLSNKSTDGLSTSKTEKERERKQSSTSSNTQRKEEQATNGEVEKISSKHKQNSESSNKSNGTLREQRNGSESKQDQEAQLYASNSNISNSSSSSSTSSSTSSNSSSSNNVETNPNRASPIDNFHKITTLEEPTSQLSPEQPEVCPFTESIERTALPESYSVFGHKNKAPTVRDLLQPTYKIIPLDDTDAAAKNGDSALLGSPENSDLAKLGLFDDNSFFSLSAGKVPTPSMLAPTNKLLDDPLRDQITGRIMPNLPDLINGIDGYQSNINCTNDWEDAFKSVILKTNKQMEEKLQQQQLHHHHQMKQQEDLRKLQELQKRNILLNSMRVSQLNNGPLGADMARHSHFMPPQQNPLLQHQSGDNALLNSQLPFENNMSKFFDFHKHQQQKMHNFGGPPSGLSAGLCDNFHMMSLLENKPLNSQLLDHNSLLSNQLQQQQQQQQQHKQSLYGKMDPMMCHQQLKQQQPPPQPPNKHVSAVHPNQQNHMKNQFLQNSNADDDLGFDPFIETQKALAELIENEEEQQQQQQQHNSVTSPHSNPIGPPKHPQAHHQQQQQPDPMLEYMQRLRLPPPGFNHMNSNIGGYGLDPRLQHNNNNNSKIMPFMNLPGNNGVTNPPPHMPPQQQQHPLQMPNPNVWSTHLGNMQQQQTMGAGAHGLRHDNCNPQQSMGNPKSGYSGSDWTAMDPAILSFRQFSFPQQQQNPLGPQLPPQPQPQQQQQPPQDLFLQHLSQQAGFGLGGGAQPQLGGGNGGANMPNAGVLNPQTHHVDANVQGMLEFLKTHQFV